MKNQHRIFCSYFDFMNYKFRFKVNKFSSMHELFFFGS
jgi:hypothetical protein